MLIEDELVAIDVCSVLDRLWLVWNSETRVKSAENKTYQNISLNCVNGNFMNQLNNYEQLWISKILNTLWYGCTFAKPVFVLLFELFVTLVPIPPLECLPLYRCWPWLCTERCWLSLETTVHESPSEAVLDLRPPLRLEVGCGLIDFEKEGLRDRRPWTSSSWKKEFSVGNDLFCFKVCNKTF